jgi:hypothetical protein
MVAAAKAESAAALHAAARVPETGKCMEIILPRKKMA